MTCRKAWTGASSALLSVVLAVLCGCGEDDVGASGGGGGPSLSVTILSPNGGETWRIGSTQSIKWISEGITYVRIELSRDSGVSWEDLALSTDASTGSLSWMVDDGGQGRLQTSCVVRISDAGNASLSDSSDREFTLRDPGVVRVDIDAPPGGDGLAWATAFRHPQDALDVALPGDEIWVAEGTYTRRDVADSTVVTMKDGVSLYAGFAGDETTRQERDSQLHTTVLDGEDVAQHVVIGASDASLDGFRVTRGNASAATANDGGGMYNAEVRHLSVTNCVFASNSADDDGGGMYNYRSRVQVADCVFTDNTVPGDGGAVSNWYGSPTFLRCTFATNSAYDGGGMATYRGSPELQDCVFDSNSATSRGGGMHNEFDSSPTLTRCVFTGNSADSHGGGFYCYSDCFPVLTNCVFGGNLAGGGGGGMYAYWSAPVVRSCTFSGNSADDYGGAVCNYNSSAGAPAITLANCVLWGDGAPDGPEVYNSGVTTLVATFCDIQGGYGGAGNIDADPLFADAAGGNFRLSAGSPCVDAADAGACPPADLDWNPRVDDPATADTGVGTPTYVDIGAYEHVPGGTQLLTVLSPDGGEHWDVGSTRTIEWACVNIAAVKIELSRDGGTSWEDIAPSVNAALHSYSWTVTDGGEALPQALCRVRITDAAASGASDTSDAEFIIGDGIWRVDAGAAPGGDGLTWATAFQHPQEAIDAASPGNEIWVAAGIYVRKAPADTVVVVMKEQVALYGGFAGSESSRHQRDWETNATVLDGEDSVYSVVQGASDARIDGFTVKRGNAAGSSTAERQGAGLCARYAYDLAVANCSFQGNQASYYGAGVYLSEGSGIISGCAFAGNTARRDGGGVYIRDSFVQILSCTFDANGADDDGGGLCVFNGSAEVVNCTFRANSAADGGGIYISATHSVVNCTLYANSAVRGGGIRAPSGGSAVTNCIIWGNSALTGPQVRVTGASTSLSVTYSCVSGGVDGVGNIDGDPEFVDAAGADLRLLPGSPCIDAADGDSAPATDIGGNIRHDDPGLANVGVGIPPYADMGGHEFLGTTTGSWVKALSPANGTVWKAGRDVGICWMATPDITTIKIELSRSGGAWQQVASLPATDRSFRWTVDDGGQALPQTGCRFRVSDDADAAVNDVSGSFAIFNGIWHVDASAPPGGDGLTWGTALAHPQDAMDAASPGEEIWVADGTYVRRDSGDVSVLRLKGDVAIYGGFAGGESARGDRNWQTNVATLDGEDTVLHTVVGESGATLDGFTVARGHAHGGSSEDQVGGGMVARATSGLVVANCAFDSSSAMDYGGGLYVAGGMALISRCTFSGNSARQGGGIYCPGGSLEVVDCAFTSNSALFRGGGIEYSAWYSSSWDDPLTIERCTFEGNSAGQDGGGMALSLSPWPSDSSPQIDGCTFSANTAQNGGGLFSFDGSPAVTNCVFWNNAASDYGGGAFLNRSDAEFTNCSMSGNSAGLTGGGMRLLSFSRVSVTNCVLWGNTSSQIGYQFIVPDVSYSNVQGGFPGNGNIDADPLFVDAAAGDLHLLPASPCIDAGNGAAAPPFDMDGYLRVDDPSVTDTGVNLPTYADMGAYEYAAPGAQGVLVTAPSGGEELPLGSALAITWQSVNVATVTVELSRDRGTTWEILVPSIAASTGSFVWTVAGPVSLDCVVRVSDVSDGVPADASDAVFAVGEVVEITAPAGGEVWVFGSDERITWRSSNVDNVRLELSRNGGADWETVVDSISASAPYLLWNVTDGGQALPQGQCLVRISDVAGGAASDTTDPPFVIWGGGIWHVDLTAPPGGNGLGWASAFRHPQDAAEVAIPGDEVWVAAGAYVRRAGEDTTLLEMADGVSIYGGFAGTEALLAERDPAANVTVLDGENVCVHVVEAASDARLDGFTVTGGNASGASHGGGMYGSQVANLVVAGCTFSGNSADYYGAGVCWSYVTGVTASDCTFSGNAAGRRGGGMYVASCIAPVVSGCVFTGNTANGTTFNDDGGAGVYDSGSSPVIEGCTFSGNTTTAYGGGMKCAASSPVLSSCVFTSNSAARGGGMVNRESSSADVTGCTFSGNSADSGGAVYSSRSDPVFTACTFEGNYGLQDGGAVYNWDSSPSFASSVFWDNTADGDGGGMWNSNGSCPVLANCSFSANAAASGGAVFSFDSGCMPVLANCILWGNSATRGAEVSGNATTCAVMTYSCIQGGHPGVGNLDADPMFVDAAGGDLRLSEGSPCIDAADGDSAPALDRDGNARRDDTGMANAGVGAVAYADTGAYEFQGTTGGTWIGVLSPGAGDALRVGAQVVIRWAATADVSDVKIELWRPGPGWETVAASTPNDRSHAWTVDDGGLPLPQRSCQVRISDVMNAATQGTSASFSVFAGVWHVDASAAAGGDGLEWGTAFRHPQDAMDATSAGDEIWVALGTYIRRDAVNDTTVLVMKPGVAIYGGFAGGETLRDARDWTLNPTVLDGENLCYHVAVGASGAVLDGFTLTRGDTGGDYPDTRGAGMTNDGVTGLVVANSVFSQNSTSVYGGGMYNVNGSSLSVVACDFTSNWAWGGGGVYNEYGNSSFTDCTFSLNSSTLSGGGIYDYSSTCSLTRCVFDGNAASRGGGGASGIDTATDCVFQNNYAAEYGGGLGTSGLVVGCTFRNNTANAYGGGGLSVGDATVVDCVFEDNNAHWGAAISSEYNSPTLISCVFRNNTAGLSGGCLRAYRSDYVIVNCTFYGNSAADYGGVISLSEATAALVNCVVWGNSAPSGPWMYVWSNSTVTATYCDIQSPYAGAGNVSLDPLFVNAAAGDLRLSAGSPCIDAADGSAAPAADIDGNARVDDPAAEPNTGVGIPPYADMGAHEYQP